MKRLRKLRFRESAVLLIVSVFLGLLFVQQVFVHTTEAQQKAKKFDPVSDQLQGSTKAPPDIEELNKGKAPAKGEERKPPTMKALIEKVRKQPGGEEKIKRATTKGKTSGINPFKVNVAHAAGSLYLRPHYPYQKLSDTFWGSVNFFGAARGRLYNYTSYLALYPKLHPPTGIDIRRPYISLNVRLPSPGWYMINFETLYGAKAYLKTWQSNSFPTLQSWDTRGMGFGNWRDHPAFLNLGAGVHYFYWILEAGTPYVYRVTVQKLT